MILLGWGQKLPLQLQNRKSMTMSQSMELMNKPTILFFGTETEVRVFLLKLRKHTDSGRNIAESRLHSAKPVP